MLALLAAPTVQAQPKTPDHYTPAAPPTAVLPKLTPAGASGKTAPSARAPLLPPPVVAVPMSPVRVPGAPPSVPAPVSAPVSVTAPAPTPAPTAKEPAPVTAAPEVQVPAAPPSAPAAVAAPLPPRKPERTAEVAAPTLPPPSPPPEPANGRRAVRVTSEAYVRATPARNGRVLDTVASGTRLEAMGGAIDGWVRVARGGKILGYVSESLLADPAPGTAASGAVSGPYPKASKEDRGCALPDDIAESRAESRPDRRRKTIAAGATVRVLADANLRVAPACDAKVKDVLEEGETVTVLGVSGGWYQVGRRGRALGYVGGSLLAETRGR